MSDATGPTEPRPSDALPRVSRGLLIGAGIGAALIALSMWWGMHVDGSERARIDAGGGATMQGPLLLALFGVLVPIVIAIVLGAGVGGSLATRAALARPSAGFGPRFVWAVVPALGISIGAVAAGALVALLAALASSAFAGFELTAGTPVAAGGLAAAIAAVSALTGVTIATLIAGVMLRPARR